MEKTMKPKFQDIINNPDTPVFIDFYADWCGPCQTMSPVIQDLANFYSGKIKVIKVDIDKNQAVSQIYKIMGVPTFVLFKNGEIVWRHSGVTPLSALKQTIDSFLK